MSHRVLERRRLSVSIIVYLKTIIHSGVSLVSEQRPCAAVPHFNIFTYAQGFEQDRFHITCLIVDDTFVCLWEH